jgi:hypothetical protein
MGQVFTAMPMVGLGGVRDASLLYHILLARTDILDPLALSIAPATLMTAWAVAVLVQFRLAFAAAARASRGGSSAAVASS